MSLTPYDSVLRAIREHWQCSVGLHGRKQERIQALPEYRALRLKMPPSGDATGRMASIAPQIAAVWADFAEEEQQCQAGRDALAIACQSLNEDDIRRMLETLAAEAAADGGPLLLLFQSLSSGKVSQASAPLIERLQSKFVPPPRDYPRNRFQRWMIARALGERHLFQKFAEHDRWMERTMTMRTLARIGGPGAEEAITPFLNDSNERIRKSAEAALRILQRSSGGDSPELGNTDERHAV